MKMYGSICLSDIPQELMYEYNGKVYVKIQVLKYKEPKLFPNGDVKFDHFIKANVKEEEDGVNYYLGRLKMVDEVNSQAKTEVLNKIKRQSGEVDDSESFADEIF